VLNHPEAETFYIQFMSFHADLIGHVTGLPELPLVEGDAEPTPPAPVERKPSPKREPKVQEKTMNSSFSRWAVAAAVLVVLGGLGAAAANQFFGWSAKSREAREKQAALEARRAEVERLRAEQRAAQEAAQKELGPATAAEQEVVKQFQAALEAARKAIE